MKEPSRASRASVSSGQAKLYTRDVPPAVLILRPDDRPDRHRSPFGQAGPSTSRPHPADQPEQQRPEQRPPGGHTHVHTGSPPLRCSRPLSGFIEPGQRPAPAGVNLPSAEPVGSASSTSGPAGTPRTLSNSPAPGRPVPSVSASTPTACCAPTSCAPPATRTRTSYWSHLNVRCAWRSSAPRPPSTRCVTCARLRRPYPQGLALLDEADTAPELAAALPFLDGTVTRHENGHRILDRRRPGLPEPLRGRPLPLGQDAFLARRFARKCKTVAVAVRAVRDAVDRAVPDRSAPEALRPGSPMCGALGTELPLAQGPMTRVSDQPGFAAAVAADAGGLPFLALALAGPEDTRALLTGTRAALGSVPGVRPRGVGVLGFAAWPVCSRRPPTCRPSGAMCSPAQTPSPRSRPSAGTPPSTMGRRRVPTTCPRPSGAA